jgi:TPR repeat protein
MRSLPAFLSWILLTSSTLSAQTAAELSLIKEKAGKGDAESQYQLGEYYLDASHGVPLKDAIEWIRKAADQGLAKAQYKMGYANTCLWVQNASDAEATRWYLLAASQGNVDSFTRLAMAEVNRAKEAFLRDDKVKYMQFRAEAMKWYKKAAEGGDRGAQFELAEMYNRMNDFGKSENSRRVGVTDSDCDYESAMKWYLKAAGSKHPHPGAMYRIGMLYLEGKGVPQDTETAIKWLELASKGGAGWASEELTNLYRSGKETKKNVSRAIELLNEQAERGSKTAHRQLGMMYYFGDEVPTDDNLAFKHLSALLEAPGPHFDGQVYSILGHMYELGKVTPRDLDKAFRYHKVGAEAGLTTSQFSLAYAYQLGRGTKLDLVEAVRWYKLAAEEGLPIAQVNLGKILMNGGPGIEADPVEGFKWTKTAAMAGYGHAQVGLAIHLYYGNGAPKDFVEAFAWANIASASGKVERARELRDEIESKLDRAQLAEAQKRSKEINVLIEQESESSRKRQSVRELRERKGA